MTTAERADLALWVALVSAAFTLGALVWEIVRHRLVGARVSVRLQAGIVTEQGHMIRRGPGNQTKPSSGIDTLVGDQPWIEVAIIAATNYGRTAISVSELALDFGSQSWWKPWTRHTVTGFPVEIHEGAGQSSSYRLRPGESATVIYDLWGIVGDGRASRIDRSKVLKVRGSALPAGRRPRRKRSPRRHTWRIEPTQDALWPDGPDHERLEIFRAVWRSVAPKHPDHIYDAWVSVGSLLMDFEHGKPPNFFNPNADPPSFSDIAEALHPPFETVEEATLPAMRIRAAMESSRVSHSGA